MIQPMQINGDANVLIPSFLQSMETKTTLWKITKNQDSVVIVMCDGRADLIRFAEFINQTESTDLKYCIVYVDTQDLWFQISQSEEKCETLMNEAKHLLQMVVELLNPNKQLTHLQLMT